MKKLLLTLLLCFTAGAIYAQLTVSGQVTSALDGEGLPGASVVVKGTTIGTTTDVDGRYQLQVNDGDAILVFSFIGYESYETAVLNRSLIDVVLYEDIQSLQELVVVGYGTSTKKELTGAVASVSSDNIQALNPQRIDQALQGQVAGVNITSASGSPGGAMNIRIRGISTNRDNNPLILVDGIDYSVDGLNALNPSDIESISVLKDATAAIYGVRGANGVIFITTKKGSRNTKPSVEFNGYYGVQETSKRLNLLNAQEFAVLKNETYAAGGLSLPYTNTNLGKGTDWQDEIFQSAPIQNYSLSVTGGSDKTAYSIGGSYLDQEGIVGGDKSSFRRYNGRINLTTDLAPKVRFENVLLLSRETRKTLPENHISSVLYNTINASPLRNVRTTEGSFTYLEEFSDIINPKAQIANSFNEAITNKLTGKQELVYDINDHFDLTGRVGYNYAVVDYKSFSPLVYYGSGKAQNTAQDEDLTPNVIDGVINHNNVREEKTVYWDYTLEAFLNYDKVFAEHHGVKATLGISAKHDEGSNLAGTGYNVPYNSYKFADISLTDPNHALNRTSSYQYSSRLLSYFLRGEYDYKQRFLFSAIIRRDASSRFGENNRFGYFPSFSGAWVISDESFFPSGLTDFAKIRASYGVLGNDRIENYLYIGQLDGLGIYPFDDELVNGIALGTMGNPDLKWETTHQANFGLDLTFLSGQLDLGVDYYIKTTRDLLFPPDVSGVLGAYGAGGSPPTINAGDVRNSGFEFLVTYNSQANNDLSFNVSYNLATLKNEVIGLPTGVDFFEYGAFSVGGGAATRMEIGYPIGYFFGYKTDGVYQSQEEIEARGVAQTGAQPGDLRFVDVNGDDVISFGDNTDKTMIGSPLPDVTMGLNLGVNFKGIDFSANIYSSIGNEILRNYERQQPLANLLNYRIGRWTGPGSTNEHPRLVESTEHKNNVLSDYFVEDGSFVRLKNIQLGYTFPSKLTERIGANHFRVYVSANNLVTLTKYMGYDPDFSSGSATEGGIDYGFYPQPRTFMLGATLKF